MASIARDCVSYICIQLFFGAEPMFPSRFAEGRDGNKQGQKAKQPNRPQHSVSFVMDPPGPPRRRGEHLSHMEGRNIEDHASHNPPVSVGAVAADRTDIKQQTCYHYHQRTALSDNERDDSESIMLLLSVLACKVCELCKSST